MDENEELATATAKGEQQLLDSEFREVMPTAGFDFSPHIDEGSNVPTSNSFQANDNQLYAPDLAGAAVRTLDGEIAGDEFAQDAINYQILLGKIDRLLEGLKLEA